MRDSSLWQNHAYGPIPRAGLLMSCPPRGFCQAHWLELRNEEPSYLHVCMKEKGHGGLHREWLKGPDGKPGKEWQ